MVGFEEEKEKMKLLRHRWKGQKERLKSIFKSLRYKEDWTIHLEGLQLVEEIPARDGMKCGKDLRGADLANEFLVGVNLESTHLEWANLEGVNLSDANLEGATLSAAYILEDRLMSISNISDVFTSAELDDIYLLHRTNIKGANLSGANLENADLSWANLEGACLSASDLANADLAKADLSRGDLMSANLDGAYLDGASLRETSLILTRFENANLSNANLFEACGLGASFRKASLYGANLRNADLKGADLENAAVNGIRYNRWAKYAGIRVDTCHGSPRFKRFAQDQDFIEEFRSAWWRKPMYWLWLITCDCGRSLSLWAAWSVVIAFFFAWIYFNHIGPEAFHIESNLPRIFDTFMYYSVVTFTTLGFGDLTPDTLQAARWVMAEVILGYVMLGGLISIFATKLARRS